jgi:hypothetical protein
MGVVIKYRDVLLCISCYKSELTDPIAHLDYQRSILLSVLSALSKATAIGERHLLTAVVPYQICLPTLIAHFCCWFSFGWLLFFTALANGIYCPSTIQSSPTLVAHFIVVIIIFYGIYYRSRPL